MADAEQIRTEVRAYILAEFLPGEPPETLADDTKLVGDGILSSIDTIKLVAFLEEHYHIVLESYEVILGPLESVSNIVATVLSKLDDR